MGLFGKSEICTVCGVNESIRKLSDGCICKNCISGSIPFAYSSSWKEISTEYAKKAICASEKNQMLQIKFQLTKKIDKYINFDNINRLWYVTGINVIFSYDDIISFELLQDGESITKGGIGSAIVGGALLGGVGAIVGGVAGKKKSKTEVNEYRIKIVTRHEMYPQVYVNFLLGGSVKSGGLMYNTYKGHAQTIISELTVITDSLKQEEKTTDTHSNADEIVKYKKLLDDGILTQEEFEAKKRQLLGL